LQQHFLWQQPLLQPQACSQPQPAAGPQAGSQPQPLLATPQAGSQVAAAPQAGSHVLQVLQQLLQHLWWQWNKPFRPQNRSQPQRLWQQLLQQSLQPLLQPQAGSQPQLAAAPHAGSQVAWQPQAFCWAQQVFSQQEGSQQQLEPPPNSIRSSNSNP
jgi:hypothetical protein